MADTLFSTGVVVTSAWLNDVNNLRYGSSSTSRGATLLQSLRSDTGARVRTAQEIFNATMDVRDFTGSGTDVGITNALAATTSGVGTLIRIPTTTISSTVVITKDDVILDFEGATSTYASDYSNGYVAAGPDWWYPVTQFVVNADRVFIRNGNFFQGPCTQGGSFIWYSQTADGGGVSYCEFNNLPYTHGASTGSITSGTKTLVFADGTQFRVGDIISITGVAGYKKIVTLSSNTATVDTNADATVAGAAVVSVSNDVAIQTRAGSTNIKLSYNTFRDCAGSVSMQGSHGSVDHCVSYITASQPTRQTGITDEAYGIDGSAGASITNCKVIRLTASAPYSAANIGANSGSYDYVLANNLVYGLTRGRGIYVQAASNYGIVSGNVVDGAGYTGTGSFNMIEVGTDCGNCLVVDNLLKSPATSTSGSLGMNISTNGNIVSRNMLALGSTGIYAGITITQGGTPATTIVEDNVIGCSNRGIYFGLTSNNTQVPMILRGNKYLTPISTVYEIPAATRNVPLYLENESYISAGAPGSLTFTIPKIGHFFPTAGKFPFRVTQNVYIYGSAIPAAASPNTDLTTWYQGDTVMNQSPAAGSPIGWLCTVTGTFNLGATVTEAGTATSGSPIITAMADTSDFVVGDICTASARFASLTGLTLQSKTSTTLTFDRNANSSGSTTMTLTQPVFVALANL